MNVQELKGFYTLHECINTVANEHPIANGARITNPCPYQCTCSAIYGMSGWNNVSSYKTCLFQRGNSSKTEKIRNHV